MEETQPKPDISQDRTHTATACSVLILDAILELPSISLKYEHEAALLLSISSIVLSVSHIRDKSVGCRVCNFIH